MATIQFKGKEIVRNYHLTVPFYELVPDEKKSLSKKQSLNDNLIIHGDNLLVLKALLPTYAGKVKCIYIDPPYNTGNENWAYNDNVNSPMMKEWLGKVVDKDDLTRHDKWLCMMMPRLKLLRELLRDDGVIFISINDIEQHHLRLLMDEVFDGGFISSIVRQTIKGGTGPSDSIRLTHDYVLVYAKDKDFVDLSGLAAETIELDQKDKKGPFAKGRELNKWDAGSRREDSPSMWFPITGPKGEEVYPIRNDGSEGRWRWGKKKMLEAVRIEDVIFEKRNDGTYIVYEKVRGNDGRSKSYQSLFLDKYTNALGTEEIKSIFDGKVVFDYPKPTELIKTLCRIASVSEGDIVLDSFAGSGTTAQSVLSFAREEEINNIKFILVQLSEKVEKDKPAYKIGFREIVDVTTERVRRVIKGVKGAKDEDLKKGLGGSFCFYELGKPIDTERILKGNDLPTFIEMARYIYFTATCEEFNENKVNEKTGLIGESKEYLVYLFYKPDMEYLKSTALTLERAEALGKFKGKKRLVFAPTKYLDQEHLERLHINFAQLPFEIYQKQ